MTTPSTPALDAMAQGDRIPNPFDPRPPRMVALTEEILIDPTAVIAVCGRDGKTYVDHIGGATIEVDRGMAEVLQLLGLSA